MNLHLADDHRAKINKRCGDRFGYFSSSALISMNLDMTTKVFEFLRQKIIRLIGALDVIQVLFRVRLAVSLS